MGHGGKREGAGAKSKAEILDSAELAKSALITRFGSLEEALQWLVKSNEPSLQKFVFEHAFGKPKEKIEHSGKVIKVLYDDSE